jgi:hypothetical protein
MGGNSYGLIQIWNTKFIEQKRKTMKKMREVKSLGRLRVLEFFLTQNEGPDHSILDYSYLITVTASDHFTGDLKICIMMLSSCPRRLPQSSVIVLSYPCIHLQRRGKRIPCPLTLRHNILHIPTYSYLAHQNQ